MNANLAQKNGFVNPFGDIFLLSIGFIPNVCKTRVRRSAPW